MTQPTPFPGNADWPADWQGVRITGKLIRGNGQPAQGSVDFTPDAEAILSRGTNTVILRETLRAVLDEHGEFDIILPASNDPDMEPAVFTYEVKENVPGGRTYHIELPLGADLELASVAPVATQNGQTILRGKDGRSAYEIAYQNGFSGTEQMWLESLLGPAGEPGAAGAKGDKGDKGDTGLGIQGLPGTKGDKGDVGANGKSAYELAVTGGFVGTQAAWLTSLQGAKGDKGLSAYEVALAGGFVGTQAAWLDSLKGVSTVDESTLTARDTSRFAMTFAADGSLVLGPLFQGGITLYKAGEIKHMVVKLHTPALGADAVFELSVQSRATGITTVVGSATVTASSRRTGVLTLTTPVTAAQGDTVYVRCTQTGTTQSGSTVTVTLLGSHSSLTPPALLAVPLAASGLSVSAIGSDLAVSWTAPASGVQSGFHVYRDDAFYATVPRGVTSFSDPGEATNAHKYTVRTINTDGVAPAVNANYAPGADITPQGVAGTGVINAQATSVQITLTSPVEAGARIIVRVGAGGPVSGTAASVWSATDTKGNTYAVDAYGYVAGSLYQSVILSARAVTALAAGDKVTVNTDSAVLRAAIQVSSIAGLINSPVDAAGCLGGAVTTSTKALSASATGTRSQAKEIVLAVFSTLAPRTATPGAGFELEAQAVSTAGSNERLLTVVRSITSSTAPVTAKVDIESSGSAYSYAVASYKGA